jgi:LysR family glycine cleavage system transcriptional activator
MVPMRRLPSLSALRVFEAAARLGSFKRAADELAVTATAVSHQVRALETHLGLPLFDRQVRKVVLTDAGTVLYPVLRDGFDAFEAVVGRLQQRPKRSRVTISATRAFTARWLVPRVADFARRHRDIDLQLHASDSAVYLGDHGVDIAIRYGRGPYPGLVAEPMFTDRFAPLANPRLGLRTLRRLEKLPLIHFSWKRQDTRNPTWETWFTAAGLRWSDPPGSLRFSDEDHAIQAAVAGQGVALLSLALVAREIEAGHLVQPFGPTLPGHTYHLVMAAEDEPRPAVEAAARWLRSQLAEPTAAGEA